MNRQVPDPKIERMVREGAACIVLVMIALFIVAIGVLQYEKDALKTSLREEQRENATSETARVRTEGIAAVQGAYFQYGLNAYVLLTTEEERARRTGHTDRIFEDGLTLYLAAAEGLCVVEADRVGCIRDHPGTLTFHWVKDDGVMRLDYDLDVDGFRADMVSAGSDVALTNIALSGSR